MQTTDYAFEARTLAPGVDLHLYSSPKRKTNQLTIYWLGDLGADVTQRALLPAVLLRGSEPYPTMRDVSRRLEYLYGASVYGDVRKIGERHVMVFRASFVNDRYLPATDEILEAMLEFVDDSLRRPFLEDGVFPAEVVRQEKENHRRHIEGLINDKRNYARERCIQEMCRDEEFRRYTYGRVEDLAEIDAASLTNTWRENLTTAPMHIYLSGNLDLDSVLPSLARFGAGRGAAPKALRDLPPLREAGPVREVEEELDVQQGKLVLGFRAGVRFGDPLHEAHAVANGVLGGFVHSKLFLEVREKASLCYYAGSGVDRSQGLLMISSGIDVEKRDQAQELILKQVKDLQDGQVSDEELTATHRAFENRLRMLEDNPRPLADIDLSWRLAGCEYDHEANLQRILAVTRDEVVEAARQWKLDTVYFLRSRRDG